MEQRLKELEELRKIEEYAIRKEQLTELKKKREEDRFKERQKTRQKIIDKQVEYLAQLKNREDEILGKHKEEADKKYNQELSDKNKRFNDLKVYIVNMSN